MEIMERLKNGESIHDVNGMDMNKEETQSQPAKLYNENESAGDTSKANTYPLTPEQEEELMRGEFYNSRMRCQDNVYADSQPYDAARN